MHRGLRSTLMPGPPSEIERDELHLPTEVITEFLSKLRREELVLPTEVITEFLLKLRREKLVLPTEIIMQILSILPTMTVVSFQCVSKLWFNILGDVYFRDLHSDKLLHCRSPSRPCPSILFCTTQLQKVLEDSGGYATGRSPVQYVRIITMKCPGATSHYVIRTHGKLERPIEGNEDGTLSNRYHFSETNHCNGLLCMAGTSGWLRWPIMLCNPATLEYLFLPPCTGARSTESSFALGFAPLSKQYKVVCIHSIVVASSKHPNPRGVLKVYTLGDDTTWRVVDPHLAFDPIDGLRPTHLYANGKIYWVISVPCPNQYRLLSFDVESEQASVMGDLPPISRGGAYGYKLAQLGGRVFLATINLWDVEVWMLKEHCSSSSNCGCDWEMRHRIRLPFQIAGRGGIIHSNWKVEGLWELADEAVFLIVFVSQLDGRLCYGRISSARYDHGQFSALYPFKDFWHPCSGYNPSLVSLKRYGCFRGEILLDNRLSSPPEFQIPPSTPTPKS